MREFSIPRPTHSLKVGSGSQSEQVGRMLIKLGKVLDPTVDDIVVVFGDTNSTLAGALAAAKLNIPVAHIEAGTRSFDRTQPEETNRVLTDAIAEICLVSTEKCAHNLLREGKGLGQIKTVGDIMVDSLEFTLSFESGPLFNESSRLEHVNYLLVTLHRPSNVDFKPNLERILDVLRVAGKPVIFPAHPRTTDRIAEFRLSIPGNVRIIEPVNHFKMLQLIKHAEKVITDSGGVQKEAYMLSRPCITIRDRTEWMETVDAGWNVLTGTDPVKMLSAILNYPSASDHPQIFGVSGVADRICNVLHDWGVERSQTF
jgi:UDP-N-acetylglucosamine 2-epimerase (non-hydrolysing)